MEVTASGLQSTISIRSQKVSECRQRVLRPGPSTKTPALAGAFLCFELFGQALKDLGVVFGEIRKRFAVEGDVGFLEGTDESRVGEAERTDAGVDAQRPEVAELALLGAAVAESVLAGFADSFVRDAFFP